MLKIDPTPSKNVWKDLKEYWETYGGFNKLINSPYVLFSIAFTILLFAFNADFPHLIVNIIPNMLGFTLGGYAILLAMGDKNFMTALAQEENEDGSCTYFERINVIFMHFILIQASTLFFGIICSIIPWYTIPYLSAFLKILGIFMLLYSSSLSIAAALAIFGLIKTYKIYKEYDNNPDVGNNN